MKRKTAESDVQGQETTSFTHAGVTVDFYRSVTENQCARFRGPMGVEYGRYVFETGTSAIIQGFIARTVCAAFAKIALKVSTTSKRLSDGSVVYDVCGENVAGEVVKLASLAKESVSTAQRFAASFLPVRKGDAEVFYASKDETGDETTAGWYYWAVFPGFGPYETEHDALTALRQTISLYRE